MSLLARYSSSPTRRHWNYVKYIFRYLQAISWRRTVKQTLVATSSNHVEILTIREASQEYVLLRSMINHIQGSCGLNLENKVPTTLFEDNIACIVQMKERFFKGDKTKFISPKFFFTHDLQKNGEFSSTNLFKRKRCIFVY